jgi:hypothetical protein
MLNPQLQQRFQMPLEKWNPMIPPRLIHSKVPRAGDITLRVGQFAEWDARHDSYFFFSAQG